MQREKGSSYALLISDLNDFYHFKLKPIGYRLSKYSNDTEIVCILN